MPQNNVVRVKYVTILRFTLLNFGKYYKIIVFRLLLQVIIVTILCKKIFSCFFYLPMHVGFTSMSRFLVFVHGNSDNMAVQVKWPLRQNEKTIKNIVPLLTPPAFLYRNINFVGWCCNTRTPGAFVPPPSPQPLPPPS
jgi:hypothetical protein